MKRSERFRMGSNPVGATNIMKIKETIIEVLEILSSIGLIIMLLFLIFGPWLDQFLLLFKE